MKIRYKNNKLEKSVVDAKSIIKNYGTRAKLVKQRLEEVKAAKSLADFQFMPKANCHELKGNRKGKLAIDISANHRIIFIPNHDPHPTKDDGGLDWSQVFEILIESIGEDYH
ncbi:MAG: killer suppression protein HigA [Prolixibacteraceae bacterium]|jgi:plasmid maintenance system killer protein|nr:killer suppression protein HigA [Prolixibacteraceae bacterium]